MAAIASTNRKEYPYDRTVSIKPSSAAMRDESEAIKHQRYEGCSPRLKGDDIQRISVTFLQIPGSFVSTAKPRKLQLLLIFLFFPALIVTVQTPPTEDFYHAAVVDYFPVTGKDGNDTLLLNTARFVTIIAEAAKYADIVVFPEASLLNLDETFYVRIPYGENLKAPADDETLHPSLQLLSLAARTHRIYVVINIHEVYNNTRNKILRYNTNIIFDRNGAIIAKYRKYNLYFTEASYLNSTKAPEHVFIDTDFGVRFGIFTCFDLVFKEPALELKKYNISDYIFPTWWYSELPFFTAVQWQSAWAYTVDSNLLAACGNTVNLGSSGSGIYAGKKGSIVYYQSNRDGTVMLTAKVFKKDRNGTSAGEIKALPEITPVGEIEALKVNTDASLKYYNTKHITPSLNTLSENDYFSNSNLSRTIIVEEEICQGGFCCFYFINMTVIYKISTTFDAIPNAKPDSFNNFEYKLATFNGVRDFPGPTGGVQVCSVISCLNSSISSCGKATSDVSPILINYKNEYILLFRTVFNNVVIKTSTLVEEGFVVPNILESSENPETFGSLMNINQFEFDHKGTTAELRLSSDRLATAGIFGRVFSRDGSKPGVYSYSSAYPILSSISLVSFATALILLIN